MKELSLVQTLEELKTVFFVLFGFGFFFFWQEANYPLGGGNSFQTRQKGVCSV